MFRYTGISGVQIDVAMAGLLRRIHEDGVIERKEMDLAARAAGLNPEDVVQHLAQVDDDGWTDRLRIRNHHVLRLVDHASPGLPLAMRRPLLSAIAALAEVDDLSPFDVAEARALADAGAQEIFSRIWSPEVVAGAPAEISIADDDVGPGGDLLRRAVVMAADAMRAAWFPRQVPEKGFTVDSNPYAATHVWRPLPLASVMVIIMDPMEIGASAIRHLLDDDEDAFACPEIVDWAAMMPDWFYEACTSDPVLARTECHDMDLTSERMDMVCRDDIASACATVMTAWKRSIDYSVLRRDGWSAIGGRFDELDRNAEVARLGTAIIQAAAGAVATHGLVVAPQVLLESTTRKLMQDDELREAVDWAASGETDENRLVWDLVDGTAMTAPASRHLDWLFQQRLPEPVVFRNVRSSQARDYWDWFDNTTAVSRSCPEPWRPEVLEALFYGTEKRDEANDAVMP